MARAAAATAAASTAPLASGANAGLVGGTDADRWLLANAAAGFQLVLLYVCYAVRNP